jgi:hypothetical protein
MACKRVALIFLLYFYVRFEVFRAATTKNAEFGDIKIQFYLTGDKLHLRYRA